MVTSFWRFISVEDIIPKEAPSEASEIRLNDPARLSQVATLDSENEKDGSQADDQDNTEIQDLTEVKEHIEPSSEESCFGNIDGSESREEKSVVIEQEGESIEYDAVEEDRENYSLEAKERGMNCYEWAALEMAKLLNKVPPKTFYFITSWTEFKSIEVS